MAQVLHADLPLPFGAMLVIVGGGEVDPELLKLMDAAGAAIVAADGGANVCGKMGVMPRAIIGDMDSISHVEDWADRTRLIEIGEQETTDFEKCLYATKSDVVVALGMTGRRLDHTLAALECAGRYADSRRIIFVDSHDLALVCRDHFEFTLDARDRLSIHPLGRVTFLDSSGLKYPLDGLVLAPGERSGTSNRVSDGRISIRVAEGAQAPFLVMMAKRYLEPLLASLST